MKTFKTQVLPLVCGIILGLLLSFSFLVSVPSFVKILSLFKEDKNVVNSTKVQTNEDLYDHTLADEMFKEVRVLCWVMTNPEM